MPTGLRAAVLGLEPGQMVTLFDLDMSLVDGPTLSWNPHDWGNIIFDGIGYVPAAADATGFERTTAGTQPRPKFVVLNLNSAITQYLKAFGGIEGCVFTRTRVLAQNLDAVNGPFATNPDVTQCVKDIFRIEQKESEMEEAVTFTLSISGDAEGFKLPARQVKANGCGWIYRGPDCGFAASAPGTIFYDSNGIGRTVVRDMGPWNSSTGYVTGDAVYMMRNSVRVYYIAVSGNTGSIPTFSPAIWIRDGCLKKVSDCKLHFGANNPLAGDFFPGTSYLPSV